MDLGQLDPLEPLRLPPVCWGFSGQEIVRCLQYLELPVTQIRVCVCVGWRVGPLMPSDHSGHFKDELGHIPEWLDWGWSGEEHLEIVSHQLL